MKTGATIKIAITATIILIIAGIWVMKQNSAESTNPVAGGNPDLALHVTEPIDLARLKSYGLPIVIDFGADSCIPCKEMAPVLQQLNSELQGRAIIKFVDVWKYEELAKDYPIRVIPTQVFFTADGTPYNPQNPTGLQFITYAARTGEHSFTTHEGGLTKDQLLSVLAEMGMK